MERYNLQYTKDSHIVITKGNKKIGKGIYSFSTLPGDTVIKTETVGTLTNVKGTCNGCCNGCKNSCYALRLAKYHHNSVIPAWGTNTLIMRKNPNKAFTEMKEYIDKHNVKKFRVNVSGEISTYNQLLKYVELAKERPNTTIYFYTKRFNFIQKYQSEFGSFPNNLIVNISKWHDNLKGYNIDYSRVNIFAYDDGEDAEIKNWVHCPAVDKNGHETGITCEQCKRCLTSKGRKTAVYAH